MVECRIKGTFRLKEIKSTNPVAVGDYVTISMREDNTAYISDILPRRNYIVRKASNLSKQSHILAANVDICLLVITVNYPVTSTTFIDRFLASAEAYRVPVVLVFNKIDLYDDADRATMEQLMALYTGITFERVYLLLLNNSMGLIDCVPLADGSINSADVNVRRIAELALFKHASGVVLAHNHPRGLAIPSGNDDQITPDVESALETLGVPLLEHIIVTENRYAPIVKQHRGFLRSSPVTGEIDKEFYQRFYGEA